MFLLDNETSTLELLASRLLPARLDELPARYQIQELILEPNMPQAVWRVAHVGLAITNPTKEKIGRPIFSLDSCWLNNSQQLLAASRRSSCIDII